MMLGLAWLCRERKKAKAAELAQQVQLLSAKAANLQTAKVKQAHLRVGPRALNSAASLGFSLHADQPKSSLAWWIYPTPFCSECCRHHQPVLP